ncbi:MAG: hypothetical protein KF902_03660 [Phycisphaeraceae bacterium]|nr:hypothetical protein [Phycisphaeraceae bacterium]
MPREPSKTYYHECDVDPAGMICLRASNETLIDVINVATRRRVALHETIYSFGGERLALSDDTRHFVAASWGNSAGGGVACYDTESGERIWWRRDLKAVQQLRFEPLTGGWFVARDRGGTHVIDRMTGADICRLRGERYFLGTDSRVGLIVGSRKEIQAVDPRSGERRFAIRPPLMYEWIDGKTPGGYDNRLLAAMHEDPRYECRPTNDLNPVAGSVHHGLALVSTVGGPLLCFDLASRTLRWTLQPASGSHFVVLGAAKDGRRVWAVARRYSVGNGPNVWEVCAASGELVSARDMPAIGTEGSICRDDEVFISGNGLVYLQSGEVEEFEE